MIIKVDTNGNIMCCVIDLFLAGPPGVCVDDNGNERKVNNVRWG